MRQSLERNLQIQAVALLNLYMNRNWNSSDNCRNNTPLIQKGDGVRLWYVTITNEGAFAPLMDVSNPDRNKFMGMAINHKKMGKISGQPDMWIGSAFQSIFIEFKSPTGKLSKAQKEVRDKILWTGIPHYVVRDLDYFIKIIEENFGIVLACL